MVISILSKKFLIKYFYWTKIFWLWTWLFYITINGRNITFLIWFFSRDESMLINYCFNCSCLLNFVNYGTSSLFYRNWKILKTDFERKAMSWLLWSQGYKMKIGNYPHLLKDLRAQSFKMVSSIIYLEASEPKWVNPNGI